MTSLVLRHLMHSVVDRIEASHLCVLSDTELILASTSLGSSALLQIRLGIPYALTQQLSKLGSVLSLLECIALKRLGDLGITLTISLTTHGQIHTNLTALTIEVVTQVVDHLLAYTLGLTVTNLMNSSERHLTTVLHL